MHEDIIRVFQLGGQEVRVRRYQLEAKEHERAQNNRAVRSGLANAYDAIIARELLLSEIQQNHETLLATTGQYSRQTKI